MQYREIAEILRDLCETGFFFGLTRSRALRDFARLGAFDWKHTINFSLRISYVIIFFGLSFLSPFYTKQMAL